MDPLILVLLQYCFFYIKDIYHKIEWWSLLLISFLFIYTNASRHCASIDFYFVVEVHLGTNIIWTWKYAVVLIQTIISYSVKLIYCIVCDTPFDGITLVGLHICLNMFSLLQ